MTVAIHNYFSICPSVVLLNDHGVFCGIPNDIQECRKCLTKHALECNPIKERDIDNWRKTWGTFLQTAIELLCFSHSSHKLLKKVYPALDDAQFTIHPHSVEYVRPVCIRKTNPDRFTIGILGTIHFHKGSKVIQAMLQLIEQRALHRVRIVIIGEMNEEIRSPHLVITGRYTHDQLEDLVCQHEIDIFLIPSIWPETFSYTTEEIINMGLPVAVYNLGAPAERVKNYEKGIILEKVDPAYTLDRLLEWFNIQFDRNGQASPEQNGVSKKKPHNSE